MEAEENLRHFLGQLLNRTEGFECLGFAGDSIELESMALQLKPQVLLLDSHSAATLPKETLRRLRQELPRLYVVLMDLEEGPHYERLAKRAGADGFLSKARVPEALDQLRARLHEQSIPAPAS